MAFSILGQNYLELLFGDKSFLTDPNGRKWTFTYDSSILDKDGHLQLITLTSDIAGIPDSSLIVNFKEEFVYYPDTFGQLHICPAVLHNQGALVSIRWDSEECNKMDESGENLISVMADNLLDWNMSEDPAAIERIHLTVMNLNRLV